MIKREDAKRYGTAVVDDTTDSVASKLNSLIPGAIDPDGMLSVEAIKEATGAIHSSKHGYGLTFAGKFIARYKADAPPPPRTQNREETEQEF